jgi:hypothetical protein
LVPSISIRSIQVSNDEEREINGNNIEWHLVKDKPGSIIRPLLDFERVEHIRISKRVFNDHKDVNNSDHDTLENIIRRTSSGNLSSVVIILSKLNIFKIFRKVLTGLGQLLAKGFFSGCEYASSHLSA